jgi:hypothetical protein
MLEDIVGSLFEGVGWGIGGAAVATALLIGGPRAKPLMKSAIKGYLSATSRIRSTAAEATETFQDLYAEAKHEYESQLRHEGETAAASQERGPVHIPIEQVDEPA